MYDLSLAPCHWHGLLSRDLEVTHVNLYDTMTAGISSTLRTKVEWLPKTTRAAQVAE